MQSDPDYKSYLDGSFYRNIYIKKEENRKKEKEKIIKDSNEEK